MTNIDPKELIFWLFTCIILSSPNPLILDKRRAVILKPRSVISSAPSRPKADDHSCSLPLAENVGQFAVCLLFGRGDVHLLWLRSQRHSPGL